MYNLQDLESRFENVKLSSQRESNQQNTQQNVAMPSQQIINPSPVVTSQPVQQQPIQQIRDKVMPTSSTYNNSARHSKSKHSSNTTISADVRITRIRPSSPPYGESSQDDFLIKKVSEEGDKADAEANQIYDFVTDVKNKEEKSILETFDVDDEKNKGENKDDNSLKKAITID